MTNLVSDDEIEEVPSAPARIPEAVEEAELDAVEEIISSKEDIQSLLSEGMCIYLRIRIEKN